MKIGHLLCVLPLLALLAGCPQPTEEKVIEQSLSFDSYTSDGDGNYWVFGSEADLNKKRKISLKVTPPAGQGTVYYLLTNTSTSPSSAPSLGGVSRLAASGSAPHRAMTASALGASGPDRRLSLRDVVGTSVVPQQGPKARGTGTTTGYYAGDFSVNDPFIFVDSLWSSPSAIAAAVNHHPSTLRRKVSVGGRTINLWVANDSWSVDGTTPAMSNPNDGTAWNPPAHLVTQTMVNDLADQFLFSGTNNDIYDWVTGIFGEEWPVSGAPTFLGNAMVESRGNIHIFVTNLNPGGTANGTMMGYFHANNNFASYTGSNKMVLFAINADSLANPSNTGTDSDTTWALTDHWPAEIVSTLAHEFEHMIHFYQKQVRQDINASTDTWIDEMAAMMTEDFVSEKLGTKGPRGVPGTTYGPGGTGNTSGRLPSYNYWHELVPLTGWLSDSAVLYSYSNAYAFGAWLARNYGGPTLLNSLVTSPYTDYQAVVTAVQTHTAGAGQTYPSLVRDWGLATFLESSAVRPGLKYKAASGDDAANGSADSNRLSWSYNSTIYQLGSIDLGNYTYYYKDANNVTQSYVGPYVYYGGFSPSYKVTGGATFFYREGYKVGTFSDTLVLPARVALTVVVTP